MDNSKDGNLFNLSIREIREGVARFRKESEDTKSKIMSDQYLAHAEYWEEVLQKMQRQESSSFFIESLKFYSKP